MAGNYKKADKEDECVKASVDAYELMLKLSNAKDAQTCRCLLNLAQVYQYFEKDEKAKELYKQFLTLFAEQTGENGTHDWSENAQMVKLRDFS